MSCCQKRLNARKPMPESYLVNNHSARKEGKIVGGISDGACDAIVIPEDSCVHQGARKIHVVTCDKIRVSKLGAAPCSSTPRKNLSTVVRRGETMSVAIAMKIMAPIRTVDMWTPNEVCECVRPCLGDPMSESHNPVRVSG